MFCLCIFVGTDLIDFLKSDLLPKLTEIDYRVKKQKVICCEVV